MNWIAKLFKKKEQKPVERSRLDIEIEEYALEHERYEWQFTSNGIPYFLYPYHKNGISLLVCKYDGNTPGMAIFVVDGFDDGKISTVKDIPCNNYQAGLMIKREYTDSFYKSLAKLKKVQQEKWITEAWT